MHKSCKISTKKKSGKKSFKNSDFNLFWDIFFERTTGVDVKLWVGDYEAFKYIGKTWSVRNLKLQSTYNGVDEVLNLKVRRQLNDAFYRLPEYIDNTSVALQSLTSLLLFWAG